jgi:hypothetical protein
MTKRKYFSWTDEKREELREYIDAHEDIKVAFKEAALLFGVSEGSCYGAYKYEPKKPIVTEVDPSELEPRKDRVMDIRKRDVSIKELMTEVKEASTKTNKLKIDIHNDINNDCLVINVNDSVTVLKIGNVIVTLEV